MNCPTCVTHVLITVEFDAVEVDYCPVCGGVWLDAGEIEAIVGDEATAVQILAMGTDVQTDEKPRRCPECRAKMDKSKTEGEPSVIYDHCPKGDGLWFDKGELATVLERTEALGVAAPVAKQLRTIFADATAGE